MWDVRCEMWEGIFRRLGTGRESSMGLEVGAGFRKVNALKTKNRGESTMLRPSLVL
jgi:hypothetical protein